MRLTEITEFPEMFQIANLKIKIIIFLIFAIPLLAFFVSLNLRRLHVILLGFSPILALILPIELCPDFFIEAFENSQKPIIFYSDVKSVRENGRLCMTLYNEARRRSSIKKLSAYKGNTSILKQFDKVIAQLNLLPVKNNVHLIVLESFLDPELLQGAKFSRKSTHPDFAKIIKDKGTLSLSPVFGGGTAQAEFEVLCGVPAMREISGVEFNVFSGAETPCLPSILVKAGYHTIATNAYVPEFFNSINAYKGLGFEKKYYPKEYAASLETYLSTGDLKDEKYMFDGDLLKQNLTFITDWIKKNPGTPLFNYVMAIYGHTPNLIDTTKRPTIIEVKGAIHDEQLNRAVNQYYYRTEALAEFINAIFKIDPKSLIILVSDHIPPLVYGPITYNKLNYVNGDKNFMYINRAFFFENGHIVKYNTINHFEIPHIILNYITQGTYCKEHPCSFQKQSSAIVKIDYKDLYMTIMAHAIDL
ncbi:MAG: sulfatase-like hydrolase/transferase [Desulfobacterales bacterium]|nr:sulfatase-like hydrolase/transferase [Desulfobacterales bacterium]